MLGIQMGLNHYSVRLGIKRRDPNLLVRRKKMKRWWSRVRLFLKRLFTTTRNTHGTDMYNITEQEVR